MTASVATSWSRIALWLAQHQPAAIKSFQRPAAEVQIASLVDAMGRPLPTDLVEWLRIVNGLRGPGIFGSLIPTLHNPLSCEDMLRRRDTYFKVYGRRPRPEENALAGTPAGEWLEAFLPVAESGMGFALFVDLRAGDLHGCVCEFDPESGGYVDAPRWTSVAHMLHEVAEAMNSGTPALRDYADGAPAPGARIQARVPEIDENGWFKWRPEPSR